MRSQQRKTLFNDKPIVTQPTPEYKKMEAWLEARLEYVRDQLEKPGDEMPGQTEATVDNLRGQAKVLREILNFFQWPQSNTAA